MTDVLRSDLRHAWRGLRRSPLTAAAVTLTMAFAIAAVAVVTAVIHTFLFMPLAYRDADRVAFLLGWNTEAGQMRFGVWPGDFVELREQASGPDRPLESAAAYQYWDATLSGGTTPARAQGYRVTPELFDLLGVAPAIGRTFDRSDVDAGRRPVVLSHGFWQRQFGGDASIVGSTVMVDDVPRVVTAVMPAHFEFPVINFKGEIWAPLELDPVALRADRTTGGTVVAVGRIARDSSIDRVQAAASDVMRRAAELSPDTNRGVDVRVIPMAELGRAEARAPLAALFIVVVLLFLAAASSVATMAVARGASRRQELAVRGALGAGRGQLLRLLAWESLIPILAAGAIGIVVAAAALQGLLRILPPLVIDTVPNIGRLGVGVPAIVAAAVGVGTAALMAACWPAWRLSRSLPADALTARTATSLPARRLTAGLVVVEVAASMVLIVAALLLARTVQAAARADLGFDPAGVLAFNVSLPPQRYPSPESRVDVFRRMIDEIAAVPGVRTAGAVSVMPFSTADSRTVLRIEGRAVDPASPPSAGFRVVTPGYADAMHLRLVEGRTIDAGDRAGTPLVAVISESVRSLLPADRPAIGARIRFGRSDDAPWLTVVGVVADVKHSAVDEAPRGEVHVPLAQAPRSSMTIAVKADGAPGPLGRAVTAAVHRVDPNQPVFGMQPLVDMVRVSFGGQQILAWVMGAFSMTAGLVAFVGLYGLISYSVARQMPEFGIRLALGASPTGLRRLVFGRALRLAAIGGAIGLAGAWAVASLLGAILIGVSARDPLAFAGAMAITAAAAIVAAAGPARAVGHGERGVVGNVG